MSLRQAHRPVQIIRGILLGAALVLGTVAVTPPAAAQASGCSRTSNHDGYITFDCYMYRSSVHVWHQWGNSSHYSLADNDTGVLNQGTSWFVCQRTFPVSVYYGNAANNWWAYTLSDNGWWGWVSADYLSGGANWGQEPGMAVCPSGFGITAGNPGDAGACQKVAVPVDGASKINFTSADSKIGGVC
jgi:hypothetical protein